jgi:glycosyltransferase involved in cell wall biosynthesis
MKVFFADEHCGEYGGLAHGIKNRVLAAKAAGIHVEYGEYDDALSRMSDGYILHCSNFVHWDSFIRKNPHALNMPHIVELHGWYLPAIDPEQGVFKEDVAIMLESVPALLTTSMAVRGAIGFGRHLHNSVYPEVCPPRESRTSGIVSVMNISRWKGIDRVLSIADKERVSVIGKEMNDKYNDGRLYIDRVHAEANFLGELGHEDVIAVLKKHEIFFAPSRLESCSLTVLEAMSCGTPVIATDAGDNREMIGDAGIIVDGDDREEILVAVDRIRNDWDRFHGNCIERSVEFSHKSIGKKLLSVYQHASDNWRSLIADQGHMSLRLQWIKKNKPEIC